MFELQVKGDNGKWETYPDPLRETREEAEEKMSYCHSYRYKNNMPPREYRVVKLNQAEIERHNEEWKKWCAMID